MTTLKILLIKCYGRNTLYASTHTLLRGSGGKQAAVMLLQGDRVALISLTLNQTCYYSVKLPLINELE